MLDVSIWQMSHEAALLMRMGRRGATPCTEVASQRRQSGQSHKVGHRRGHELHDDEELAGARLQHGGIVLRDVLRLAPRQRRHLLCKVAGGQERAGLRIESTAALFLLSANR